MGQATAVLTQYMPIVSRGPAWQVGVSSTSSSSSLSLFRFVLGLDCVLCLRSLLPYQPMLMFTPGLLCCLFGRSGVSGQLSMFLLINNGFSFRNFSVARLASVSYCAYLFLLCCMIC